MKALNKTLLCLFCILVALIPLAYSFADGISDPFLHGIVSSVLLYQSAGEIPIGTTQFRNVPGLGSMWLMLSDVSGFNPVLLEFLPIAGGGLFLASFVFARRLTNSLYISLAITLVVAFSWLSPTLATMWPHTFGFTLYLLFVLTYMKLRIGKQVKNILVLWMLFLGMHFLSYTSEFWTITFVGAVTLVGYLKREPGRSATVSLFVALLATFFGFTEIIYTTYIPDVGPNEFGLGLEYFLSHFLGRLRISSAGPYAWVAPSPSPVILGVTLGWYSLLFLPLILAGVRIWAKSGKLIPSLASLPVSAVIIGFWLVWLADAVSYALIGALTIGLFRYSTLGAAFFAAPSVNRIVADRPRHKLKRHVRNSSLVVCCLLVVFSMTLFASGVQQNIQISSKTWYASAKPSAVWLLSHRPGVSTIFSDQVTQGQFAIEAARQGIGFSTTHFYDPPSFAALVNPPAAADGRSIFSGQYIVVNLDLARFKTSAGGWFDLEPLGPHLSSIGQNSQLDLVYDDGSVWILSGR